MALSMELPKRKVGKLVGIRRGVFSKRLWFFVYITSIYYLYFNIQVLFGGCYGRTIDEAILRAQYLGPENSKAASNAVISHGMHRSR